MHKIDKHTGLYLEWGGPYLSPVVEDMEATKNEHPYEAHIMSKSGLFVDDVRKPQEPPEFNSVAVTYVLRSQPFQIVVNNNFFSKGQVVYLEDNEQMTIKSNPKKVGLCYAYETDICNQFLPGTRIYAFKR